MMVNFPVYKAGVFSEKPIHLNRFSAGDVDNYLAEPEIGEKGPLWMVTVVLFFGELTFQNGVTSRQNFDSYRIIRQGDTPKSIEVHFVKKDIDPTGLGELLFPPILSALANSLWKTTGKRFYKQPFQPQMDALERDREYGQHKCSWRRLIPVQICAGTYNTLNS